MSHPVLDLPMQANDINAATIRDYLKELLKAVVKEGALFSSKRPFGNSDWEYDMYRPLVTAGLVSGELGEDDDFIEVDFRAADKLLVDAIDDL